VSNPKQCQEHFLCDRSHGTLKKSAQSVLFLINAAFVYLRCKYKHAKYPSMTWCCLNNAS
jgi:hypothetical protein